MSTSKASSSNLLGERGTCKGVRTMVCIRHTVTTGTCSGSAIVESQTTHSSLESILSSAMTQPYPPLDDGTTEVDNQTSPPMLLGAFFGAPTLLATSTRRPTDFAPSATLCRSGAPRSFFTISPFSLARQSGTELLASYATSMTWVVWLVIAMRRGRLCSQVSGRRAILVETRIVRTELTPLSAIIAGRANSSIHFVSISIVTSRVKT